MEKFLQPNPIHGRIEKNTRSLYAHFWEDICCKNGLLVWPDVFRELAGPWYRKITNLVKEYGIDIVSVDCDGLIDKLIPVWLENGVSTMFPIEVGTWNASIAPWREKYGRELRGVGGMNKNVFSRDKAAVEAEVEWLQPWAATFPVPTTGSPRMPDLNWCSITVS